jgi:DNA polymerase-3 subunit delta'
LLMNIFDWQKVEWARLLTERRKLPHALLLAGTAGVGKFVFAQALAAHLLCEKQAPDGTPCGLCSSCILLSGGNHPDFRLIRLEETDDSAPSEDSPKGASPPKSVARQIGIDQVRALEDFVFLGSHRLGNRVVLVSPAVALTLAAENSLLKLLEEPPAGVYFILVSSEPRRLLPTILSRCQRIDLGPPDRLSAQRWLDAQGHESTAELLDLTGGAPLIAADWAARGILQSYRKAIDVLAERPVDPVAMAAQWAILIKGGENLSLADLVVIVQKWLLDLALIKFAGSCRYHVSWQPRLRTLAGGAHATNLLACYNDFLRIKAVVRHPLNTQLFLEDMAARYLRALAGRT